MRTPPPENVSFDSGSVRFVLSTKNRCVVAADVRRHARPSYTACNGFSETHTMNVRSSSLIRLMLIATAITLTSSSVFGRILLTHSAPDSIVFVQFGIDSAKVDSILTNRIETSRFLFRYSDNFSLASELHSKASLFDAHCDTVTRLLDLPKSEFKTTVYLYANATEWSLCFKGWPPPTAENQAVTLLREIHANALLPLEHEIVHILVNDLIAYAKSSFFAEGVAQYVQYVRSNEEVQKAVRIAKKVLSEPWDKWANDSIGFWSTGQIESIIVTYPVSGLFVKQLIESHGLKTFKEFYRRIRTEATTEAAFAATYGHPLSKAIAEFKTTIATWQDR
jgi:hypothetical protein